MNNIRDIIERVLSLVAIVVLAPVLLFVGLLVYFTSRGPVLFWSNRVGIHNSVFNMPKFRTMLVETPEVASHLLAEPDSYLTPVGGFLRRSSLDELPQLLCIVAGDMRLVGPRPALHNQEDLINLRTELNVDKIKPGLTGLAQVSGRDELSIREKVLLDKQYMEERSLRLDMLILIQTCRKILLKEDISH